MLRDEQALGDLVRAQMLVEEQQHLDLSGGEDAGDLLGNAAEPAAIAYAIEEPARDTARECCVTARDASQERCDLLRGFGLEQVAGRAGSNRC